MQIPDDLPPDIAEAYRAAAEKNVLAALNPKVFFGYFSVCADGRGHGGNTTFPGLDWGQSAEALLWLGRSAEVLASWEYVKGFQREDGLVPFAILPGSAGQTMGGKYPLTVARNGAVFEHWVPGNPLRTLANVTTILLMERIYSLVNDFCPLPDKRQKSFTSRVGGTEWLAQQAEMLHRSTTWLIGQVSANGMVSGGGFYVERPTRPEYDGVNQCYTAHALQIAAGLLCDLGDAELSEQCGAVAQRIIACFREQFWAGDHCVEYIHPERGAIHCHGLTDVDWAAIATAVASEEQVAILWPQLRDHPGFLYSGMPTGIATQPETYEDWEMQGIDRHDLAAMGRVWYLESWARARMGDRQGILRAMRRVISCGQNNNWHWRERYYSQRTGDLGRPMDTYCEYPANLIRIVHRFLSV